MLSTFQETRDPVMNRAHSVPDLVELKMLKGRKTKNDQVNKANIQVNSLKIFLKITQKVGRRAQTGLMFPPTNRVFN